MAPALPAGLFGSTSFFYTSTSFLQFFCFKFSYLPGNNKFEEE